MVIARPSLVVADAGPLIHLDELDALDVLSDYAAVFVPNAVWLEVQRHRPEALLRVNVNLVRQLPAIPSARINAMAAMYTLHHGEREALALCQDFSIGVLLTDDTAARLAAKSMNIISHGTLGLLLRAVRQRLRTSSEILDLLEAIPHRTTLHIRSSLLNQVIEKAKIEWQDKC